MQAKISPNLWFDTEALDAAEYYASVFPNSRVTRVTHYNEAVPSKAGTVLTVEFELDGRPYLALNGGPQLKFTEAVSFMVSCADQDEVDPGRLGDRRRRVVVGGDHDDRFAVLLHLDQPRQADRASLRRRGMRAGAGAHESSTSGWLSTATGSLASSTWTTR